LYDLIFLETCLGFSIMRLSPNVVVAIEESVGYLLSPGVMSLTRAL